jgi:glutamate dehydrogenase
MELAYRVAGLGPAFAALDVAQVTQQSGHREADVAAVLLGLGARLHLNWLCDRILELPRDERWSSLARVALRDDLSGLHSALTALVLQHSTGGGTLDPDERIDAWTVAAGGRLMRFMQVVEDIRAANSWDLAILSVAVRELRSMTNTLSAAVAPVLSRKTGRSSLHVARQQQRQRRQLNSKSGAFKTLALKDA